MEAVESQKLKSLFDELCQEKSAYQAHLDHVLADYLRRAQELPALIREVASLHGDNQKKQ
jgi:hypothetical protein